LEATTGGTTTAAGWDFSVLGTENDTTGLAATAAATASTRGLLDRGCEYERDR
jgi:hypothetical protein